MKEREAIRVTLLLFYLFLVTKGKDARTIDQLENTSQISIDQQANRTITIRTIVHLICIFIIVLFWGLTSRRNIKLDGRW
jgi:Ca2+/Na+ antiporter